MTSDTVTMSSASAGQEWHYFELLEISKLIQSGKISSVQATQAQLDRIACLDGHLRSYAHVMANSALEEARRADAEIAAGSIRGTLHGVPIAVKDLCWTRGVPTAAGMTIYRDFRPDEDATVVRKLREAGAVILGKLQLTESAYADHHPRIPSPLNPWNGDHWPGVSSSGSGSATAAGLCYGSLGSDTGGSIRFPSAANGITGIKPTWGRVSRYGVFELAATLDHIGPMARSAADAGALLRVIAGADENDPTASTKHVPDYLAELDRGLDSLRVGVDPAWNRKGVDAESHAAVATALDAVRSLGGELVEVNFPDTEQVVADWFDLCGIELPWRTSRPIRSERRSTGPASRRLSNSAVANPLLITRRSSCEGTLSVAASRRFSSKSTSWSFQRRRSPRRRWRVWRSWARMRSSYPISCFTCPFDMTGNPTITLPAGFTAQNTPVAFQFAGRHFDEQLLVRAGHAFQSMTDFHKHHPQL